MWTDLIFRVVQHIRNAVGSYLVVLGEISGLAVFMVRHVPFALATSEEYLIYVKGDIAMFMSC